MAIFNNAGNKEKTSTEYPKPSSSDLSNANTHIAKGAVIVGNIEMYGTARVEGKVYGTIVSKGKISIGDSAVIEGNILAQNAEIAGKVNGTIEITELLTLKATAEVHGNIFCQKLIVDSGAVFEGKSHMGQAGREIVLGELERQADKGRTDATTPTSTKPTTPLEAITAASKEAKQDAKTL